MNTQKQKKIALINDITGFGRCSCAVALPIISAMKIECCLLPTAILSANTAYPSFYFNDYTDHMTNYINNWKELNLSFDGIYTGFLGSEKQISIVKDFIKYFKIKNTKVIVDPVMGDNGELYSTYNKEMCINMRELVKMADVITPNLTEVCTLLDVDYKENFIEEEIHILAEKLTNLGPSVVIITGVESNNKISNYIYEKNKNFSKVTINKKYNSRCGTGDAFASIISADILNKTPLKESVKKASDFISKCLEYTSLTNTPQNEGICFEQYLTELY